MLSFRTAIDIKEPLVALHQLFSCQALHLTLFLILFDFFFFFMIYGIGGNRDRFANLEKLGPYVRVGFRRPCFDLVFVESAGGGVIEGSDSGRKTRV